MIGVSVPKAIAAFVEGAFGSPFALAASLNRSSIFALVGFGFVLANRANLTNVGGEGQIACRWHRRPPRWRSTAMSAGCRWGSAFILPKLAASDRRRACGAGSPRC
jgi:simple sugar transport system permease protein